MPYSGGGGGGGGGNLSGTLTSPFVPKASGANTLVDSIIQEDGVRVNTSLPIRVTGAAETDPVTANSCSYGGRSIISEGQTADGFVVGIQLGGATPGAADSILTIDDGGTGTTILTSNRGQVALGVPGNAVFSVNSAGASFGSSGSTLIFNDTQIGKQSTGVLQQGADAATASNQTYKGADSTGANTAGGNFTLAPGDGTSGNANGGTLNLNGGNKAGTGVIGSVSIGGGLTGTNLKLDRTITAGGTTGAQVINKIGGTVNFAAAAVTLVVTNSLVDASSIIFCTVRTNDATAIIKNVVPAAGSFTITLNAAATAETSVGFLVTN